jgi:hypothetical protein
LVKSEFTTRPLISEMDSVDIISKLKSFCQVAATILSKDLNSCSQLSDYI